jgi:hypothetical protein
MATTHGSKAVFKVQDSGGVLRDLSAYLTSAGLSRSADTAEITTLGSTSKTYIPGLLDGTIPIEGHYDPTVDGYLAGILGMERPFEYYPAGEPASTSKPKYTGSCILTSYEASTPVDDAGSISGEFQVTGAVTRATS